VDFLERRGLARRLTEERDGRIRWVRPTPAGRRINGHIHRDLRMEYAQLLGRFSAAFVKDAARLLEALADRAASNRHERPPGPKRRPATS
jgi:DNA-binding MarR family transcriptional regulator